MALLSNAGSFPPIKFSYIENEFGANGGNVKIDHSISDAVFLLTIYK